MTNSNTTLLAIVPKILDARDDLRAVSLAGETAEQQLAIARVADTLEAALAQLRHIADPEWFKHD
jgi:hypothetical protein